jgi:hypothetical protein
VLVYRSTNAGGAWTLEKTIAAIDGFAVNGAHSSYYLIDAAPPSKVDLVMPGNAAYNIQQFFWVSSDAGLTWTALVNEAVPKDESDEWMVYGPGGLIARPVIAPMVAIPSRLATIVG